MTQHSIQDNILGLGDLAFLATGRTSSLFTEDMLARRVELETAVAGKRILVIGGAGSIGSAVVKELARRKPATLHIVDQSENSLAELVRSLRGDVEPLMVADFRTLPLDYGSPVMSLFLDSEPAYDLILNFAALKHVRSEKDPWSLLQMLDTNIAKQVRFMTWLAERRFEGRYFCVSTDKAANPVSLMGASKRLMEHVIFSREAVPGFRGHATSARFANVAFSDGSLLQAWLQRLTKHQPMAAPMATKRYFVSLEEAGHICVLAALCAPQDAIVVPNLDPSADLHELAEVASALIGHIGLRPACYQDENLARKAVESDLAQGKYPLLLTPLDTSGEKPYEEFVGLGETAQQIGLSALQAVSYLPAPAQSLSAFLTMLTDLLNAQGTITKAQVVKAIARVIPQFHHRETGQNLDQRI